MQTTNPSRSILLSDAEAARYAGWYAGAPDAGPDAPSCEICGSSEDVTYSGAEGDLAVCLDCAERPPRLWDPYFDAVYGGGAD